MLSGESTPLLKESVALRPAEDTLDIDGVDRNSVLFGGTKVLQSTGVKASGGKLAGTRLFPGVSSTTTYCIYVHST